MTDRTVTRGEAADALADLAARQRLLRTTYAAARYGWPETVAVAWARRPETFEPGVPVCRATRVLDGLS